MNDFVIRDGVLEKYEGMADVVNIPSEVVEIGVNAFFVNSSIVSLVIPNGVKKIWNCAFKGCSKLEKIIFPEGLETIGAAAFGSCKSLKTVILPNSVSFIDRSVFEDCTALEKVVLNSNYKTDSLYSSRPRDGVFCGCDCLKTAGPIGSNCDIEFSWTDEIPKAAFWGLRLSKATIPDHIKSIGSHGFDCVGGQDFQVTLPSNCKLDKHAFCYGTQIIFSNPIASKDRLDPAFLDYVDNGFVERLSNEELAWIILYQSKKWRSTVLSLLNNDQQLVDILVECQRILKDTKKVSKSIGDAIVELISKIKDDDLRRSTAEELYCYLKDHQ